MTLTQRKDLSAPSFFQRGGWFSLLSCQKVLFILLITTFCFSSLLGQPEKKVVFIKPDVIQTFSENELLLLDSVFQVRLSSENKYPAISSVLYEKDSVRVVLLNENNSITRTALSPSPDFALPYLWMITAGGTLSLFILLYFVRF